ncbi:unnamed protein product, partial [Prorocentrum cordatum]
AQERYKESQVVQASPQECYTKSAKKLKWKADALERASKAELDAEHKLEVAREATKRAALEHARAKQEHEEAVARVAAEANIQHVPQGYTSDGKRVVFAVDDTLFQDIGAFAEEEQRVLRALEAMIKEQCDQVAAIQKAVHEQFAKVKDIRSGASKRQRTGEQGQSAVGTGGTMEYDSEPEDQHGEAKSPAHPNEDSPDLLAAAEADRAAALEAERKRIASNAKAGGGKGHKFRGPNEKTLIRLAAFPSQVKESWLVMGDWNMHPSEWSKTSWLEKLDALVWEQARMLEKTQDSRLGENRELFPHFLQDRGAPARCRLASSCASWATTLEEATIITHKLDQQEADKVRGRAKGFAFKWARTRATPDRPHLRDPVAEWWNICSALANRAGVLRRSQRISDLQVVFNKIEGLLSINNVADRFTIFHDEDKFKCWLGMVAVISELDDTGFSDLQQMTNQFLSRAIGRSLSKASKSFQLWMIRMWKSTPGVIHRYTRGVLDKADEIIVTDRVFGSPSDIMDHRADSWQKVWSSDSFSADKLSFG